MKPATVTVPRHRQNSATDQRINRLRCVVDSFSDHEMSLWDVCVLLDFSHSGARKYVQQLRDAGVIVIDRHTGSIGKLIGTPIFRLTTEPGVVEEFMALLGQPSEKTSQPAPSRPVKEVAPWRHVHLLGDDRPAMPLPLYKAVSRDPWVAALFGDVAVPGSS